MQEKEVYWPVLAQTADFIYHCCKFGLLDMYSVAGTLTLHYKTPQTSSTRCVSYICQFVCHTQTFPLSIDRYSPHVIASMFYRLA